MLDDNKNVQIHILVGRIDIVPEIYVIRTYDDYQEGLWNVIVITMDTVDEIRKVKLDEVDEGRIDVWFDSRINIGHVLIGVESWLGVERVDSN